MQEGGSFPNQGRAPPSQLTDEGQHHLDQDSEDLSDEDLEYKAQFGKRKRPLSASCELCKQRKVKCDRNQPACGWCARNGAICEYKERRKPGLRANYGRNLERRLDSLEEVLKRHEEVIQMHSKALHAPINLGSRGDPSLPSESGTPQEVASQTYGGRSDPLKIPQTEGSRFAPKPSSFTSSMRSLPVNLAPLSTGQDNFASHVGGMAPASTGSQVSDLRMSAAEQDYYGASRPDLHCLTAQLPEDVASRDEGMPPYDLLYALVDLFFKHINTWCPILDRKTTLDSLFGPSTLQETDRILLHAIVATTMRYSTDHRLTEERRKHFHEVSKQRVLLYGIENSSVKSLQALVILALDLVGSSNGPPGWNIMALITRSVVQLGLAVESTSSSVAPRFASIYTLRAMLLPEPKDFIEDESRRRLFWMIYLLDRYATVATAFEFALGENEIDRMLPCRDDLWIKNQQVETRWFKTKDHEEAPDHPENLGVFSFHIEIIHIISKIHQFLKEPVDIGALGDVEQWQMRYKELDTAINNWRFRLPPDMGNLAQLLQSNGRNLSVGWIMVHVTYHTAIIRLHSSAAYPTTRSPIFTPSYSASQQCHSAAESIAALCDFVVKNCLLSRLGPPFAFSVWVAARVLLVHSSTVEHKLEPQVAFFVDILRELGQYWRVAARYCELLQRVLDEHSESKRQGDGVTPSAVKILADMRRTAFDLDFLISRQPRLGGGAGVVGRMPTITPNKTPAPNELEYLDVFDFFNVPRLPFGGENTISGFPQTSGGANMEPPPVHESHLPNEFNIQNFLVDANSDWLYKQEGSKFMAGT